MQHARSACTLGCTAARCQWSAVGKGCRIGDRNQVPCQNGGGTICSLGRQNRSITGLQLVFTELMQERESMQRRSRNAPLIHHPKGLVEYAARNSALFKNIAERPVRHGFSKTNAILDGVCNERRILRTPLGNQERQVRHGRRLHLVFNLFYPAGYHLFSSE